MRAAPTPGRWIALGARLAVSVALLWLVFRRVDVGDVLDGLSALRPGWVVAGLAVSVVQVVGLSWRWRYTAGRLGIELPMRAAMGEYYLSILLNQVLPGGVLGDVSRAWRHARTGAPTGSAVRAVVLERASAQVVMTLTAIVSVLWLPWASALARGAAALAGVTAVVLALLWLSKHGGRAPGSLAGRLWDDTHRALLSPGAFAVQAASAILVVGSYVVVFLVAARAVGAGTSLLRMIPLVAPVLMTMLVPVTIAGWGIREAAAAALWSFAGMRPEDGAAISVAYGLIVLASSAPGVISLVTVLRGGPDRTARPPRA